MGPGNQEAITEFVVWVRNLEDLGVICSIGFGKYWTIEVTDVGDIR